MNDNISDELLARLSQRINAQIGLHFPEKNWLNLKRGIRLAAPEFGFDETNAFAQWLVSSPLTKDQIKTLAYHLTIGETYFFREMKTFDALQEHVLPEILLSRQGFDRRLRIWSAGCSSGEEAYSIAILLTRMIPDITSWKISILATDVNPRSLHKATEGIYTEWSFRKPPLWLKDRYFIQKGKQFTIQPEIKRMVTFEVLNLAEDIYPSLSTGTNAMDIIFCRNVLMYFSRSVQDRVIENFYHALVDGGWLIVSPSEASSTLFPQFVTINFPNTIFFLKGKNRKDLLERWFPRLEKPDNLAPLLQTPGMDSTAGSPHIYSNGVIWDQKQPRSSQSLGQTPQSSLLFQGSSHDTTEMTRLAGHGLQTQPRLDISKQASLTNQTSDRPISPELPKPPELREPRFYEEAEICYHQGRYAEVIERLIKFNGLSTHSKALDLLARAYANQGNIPEALKWSEKAVACDKLNPCLHYLRATILIEQNQLQEATEALRRALFLDPNFVLAYFALGNLARQQGRMQESKKYLDNVCQLLKHYPPEEVLPETDGMTASRLGELVNAMLATEETA